MIYLPGNRILIRRSGIYVIDGIDYPKGEVLAISNGEIRDAPLSIGDTVIFREEAGEEVFDEGEKFLVLKLSDVIGII
ncbi:MAG: hypothetical protein HY602_01910, partial [Parcubacteria group bacterium]|nr:hypothetical protein [Parcubacteria group bacterium]